MQRSPIARGERLPSASDVAFYREHGWWVARRCISEDRIVALLHGIERYYAGERDFELVTTSGAPWTEDPGRGVKRGSFGALQMAEFRAFVRDPLLPAMAARLAGSAEIRLFHDQIWYKEAAAVDAPTELDWHTDKTFWNACSSDEMLTAWIPLQDCTPEMGPLRVIDGSHRWPGTDSGTFERRSLPSLSDDAPGSADGRMSPTFTLRRGDVAFHNCRTIHGSGANRSTRARVALCIHYQDGANAYRPDASGARAPGSFIIDHLCARTAQGLPDYADPTVCLPLWPANELEF